MRDRLLRACYFLHITDGVGQLDIVDLSFMLVVGRLILAPNFDWPAVCTLIPIIAQQMHTNHLDAKQTVPKV